MKTLQDVIEDYQTRHNFGKELGFMTKPIIVNQLSERFKSPAIKLRLAGCKTFFEMVNAIQKESKVLTEPRTPEQITEFENSLKRLIKLARL